MDPLMKQKTALITGITGQDGAYLAEFLLKKGYIVHGIRRRTSLFNTRRIDHLYMDAHEPNARLHLHYGDMTDSSSLMRVIQKTRPDEIYNLAAQSHVAVSFEEPGVHRELRCAGNAATPGGGAHPGHGEARPLLSGVDVRAVRSGAGDSPEGDDAVLSALAVRGGEVVCVLDHHQLSRGVRHVCLQRRPVQSRVAESGRDLCDAKDHARGSHVSNAVCRNVCISAI